MKLTCICDTETNKCDCEDTKSTSTTKLSPGAIIGIILGTMTIVGILSYLSYKKRYNTFKELYGVAEANKYAKLGFFSGPLYRPYNRYY